MQIKEIDLHGWFPGQSQTLLEPLMKKHGIQSVIEIGCFLGRATFFFAQRCDKVTVVDTFEGNDEPYMGTVKDRLPTLLPQFLYNMAHLRVATKIHTIALPSEIAACLYPDLTADLVYIDASHKYLDVKEDIRLWLPRAKKVFCGDDYTNGVGREVKQAVDELLPQANRNQRLWYVER